MRAVRPPSRDEGTRGTPVGAQRGDKTIDYGLAVRAGFLRDPCGSLRKNQPTDIDELKKKGDIEGKLAFEGIQKNVVLKSEEIKGPNIKSPEIALEGFVRSNKILKKDLYQKKTEKELTLGGRS